MYVCVCAPVLMCVCVFYVVTQSGSQQVAESPLTQKNLTEKNVVKKLPTEVWARLRIPKGW